jgi:hypothetical protein
MIWLVFLVFIAGAALAIAITTYLHAWDSYSFWGMFIVTVVYIALIAFMVWYANYLKRQEENKFNMKVAWENVCKNIQSFPGENTLEWAKGINRNGERRTFVKGNQEKNYFAFFGILGLRRQYAIVIWCIEDAAIVRYNTTNDPKMMGDVWEGFKPFESAQPMHDGMPYDLRSRMKGRYPYMPYSDSGYGGVPMPDQSIIEDFNSGQGQNKGGERK